MKIFVSSVIRGFEQFRDAAARAANVLRHEVKRAEDFAASPATPQQACLVGVRWADAVILLLGARYGERQPSGMAPTHEEYREARERCPVLVFVERGVRVEPGQQEFLSEVQGWTTGHYTVSFSDADELRDAVTSALRDLELAQATGPIDEREMLERAEALVPDTHNHVQGVTLTLVVAGGPRQQVLRPRELEAPGLEEDLSREALFGDYRILDRAAGTRHSIRDNALVIEQDKASILVDQLGTVRLVLPAERPRTRGDFAPVSVSVAIREEVEEQRALRFVAWVQDRIDTVRRISDVVPLASSSQGRSRLAHPRRARAEPQQLHDADVAGARDGLPHSSPPPPGRACPGHLGDRRGSCRAPRKEDAAVTEEAVRETYRELATDRTTAMSPARLAG